MQLGKNGITDDFLIEINKNLKAKYDVRVRMLKSFLASTDRFSAHTKFKEAFPKKNCKLVGNVVIISR